MKISVHIDGKSKYAVLKKYTEEVYLAFSFQINDTTMVHSSDLLEIPTDEEVEINYNEYYKKLYADKILEAIQTIKKGARFFTSGAVINQYSDRIYELIQSEKEEWYGRDNKKNSTLTSSEQSQLICKLIRECGSNGSLEDVLDAVVDSYGFRETENMLESLSEDWAW